MIKLKNIKKTYYLGKSEVLALHEVNLQIATGDFVCIMGPSGSGKSTLLNLIGLLDRPDDGGQLFIGEEEISLASAKRCAEIRSEKIGFIFQSFNLIPVFNVFENVEFPLYISQKKFSSKERKRKVEQLVDDVGLTPHIKHRPDELSGGQRQRVAIARALITNPSIVLADEPTANLDSKTGNNILELMKNLNTVEKTTFIFATHDPKITGFASQKIELQDGRIVK
ncbi:MAG: ABC transporter ATP-binding protein [Oligoflexia bacterium]|nr:ABC transporter ATP-binding protein [Oligoflexia bacterium]